MTKTVSLVMMLQNLSAAMVVLDERGEVIFSTPSGIDAFHHLVFQVSFLDENTNSELFNPKVFLSGLMKNPWPTYVTTSDRILKISPVPAGGMSGDAMALLEWLPESGNERLHLLQEVSRAVNSSLILEDIFDSLGEVLRHYISYREAVIVILDDTQNSIKILVRMQEDGFTEITGENHAFAGSDPIVDQALRSPIPRRYQKRELNQSLLFSESDRDSLDTALAIPLINKGVVIGLIAMGFDETARGHAYQQDLLIQVSEQLAVAVENAKFYLQTQVQAGREFLINQIAKAINQSLEINDILQTAAQEVGKVTGVSRCFIHYFQQDRAHPDTPYSRVYHYFLHGIPPMLEEDHDLEIRIFHLRSQTPEAEQFHHPFILNDARDCPASIEKPSFFERNDIKSMAVFPILVGNQLVGTITLHQCTAIRSWIIEDIELLKAICEHLGIALKQAQLFAELESQKSALELALSELQQTQVHLIQSEKMAVLGQFVAGIAHEVNTPLGTITSNNTTLKGCVERIRQEGEDPAQWKKRPEMLDMMGELLDLNKLASERIHDIVRNLRNFVRLDESELKTVDLHQGIDSTLLVMKGSLPRHIEIIRDYAEGLPEVQCYPGLLNQVFMNILVNGTHAMAEQPEGSITIRTRYDGAADRVEVAFTDTGTGIAAENIPKLFDPGFTTKRRGLGTGLGLALCHKMVEKHHGRIVVESIVGEGSTFTVEIPVHRHKSP